MDEEPVQYMGFFTAEHATVLLLVVSLLSQPLAAGGSPVHWGAMRLRVRIVPCAGRALCVGCSRILIVSQYQRTVH